MIYQFVVALSFASLASATLYREDPTHQKYLWESFKRDFHKYYDSMDEETHRFAVFLQNLREADGRNAKEMASKGNAVHGITKFSDLSQAEFEAHYLTADPKFKTENRVYDTTLRSVKMTLGAVDWSDKYTTPVKDQGYCGSCWAFSTTEQIESDIIRTGQGSFLLSVEQIVQCDTTSYGCDGGWTENAYNYVTSQGGMETEANYPYSSYQGVTGKCSLSKTDKTNPNFVVTVSGFTTIGKRTDGAKSIEEDMAAYVQATGPLSVCVDASNWGSYNGGIMKSCGSRVNHCVQAVGVDYGNYWKLRNSWGSSWGESGYIRLVYGQDTCHLTNDATYAAVSAK